MAQTTAEKRTTTRRVVGLLDTSIAGPVASLWVTSLHRHNSGRLSDSSANLHGSDQRTRFCTTKTEHAMDSIIPSAPEEWLRGFMEGSSKFGNPSKLNFRPIIVASPTHHFKCDMG